MKSSTAYNHSKRLLSQVTEVLCRARSCAMTHDEVMAAIQERVYDDPAWAKMPHWARARVSHAYLDGATRLYRPEVSACDLDWREERIRAGLPVEPLAFVRWFHTFKGEDGVDVHVTNWNDIPAPIRATVRDGDACLFTSAHRWNHRRDRVY